MAADKFAKDATSRVVTDGEGIPDGWLGLDVGPASTAAFAEAVGRSKLVRRGLRTSLLCILEPYSPHTFVV